MNWFVSNILLQKMFQSTCCAFIEITFSKPTVNSVRYDLGRPGYFS